MSKISTSDFQKGIFIEFKSEPHQIVEFQHVNPGKGSAFIRTKLKHLISGRVQEFTYKSGETVEQIPIATRELQYLYKENMKYIFMDNQTYEQYSLEKNILGTFSDFLQENEIYQVLIHEGNAVGMRFPKKVRLKVTFAEEGIKGNTVTGARKPVTVETGVVVNAPLFIKTGDTIAIDPATGEYLERVSQE
jgi:elongation factor P